MGRPSLYKDEYAKQAYKLCLLGATDKDMADFFCTSEQTINAWKNSKPEFLEALKRGKMEADGVIAEKLFHRAKGYSHPEEVIKVVDHEIVRVDTYKHYPPDTIAAIFWLKNRQPAKWRDKHEIEHDGTFGVNIIDNIPGDKT